MNSIKHFMPLSLIMLLSACTISSSTSTTQSANSSLTTVAQIQKATIEISCQDLKNPAYQQVLLNSINQIRQQPRHCGQQYYPATTPLSWNNDLYHSAVAHAQDMADHNFLSHVSSTGLELRARLKLYQFKGHGGGENVARGQKNLEQVLQSWISSPVHCRNLMHAKFTDYAIACTPDQSTKQKSYWTQQFGVR